MYMSRAGACALHDTRHYGVLWTTQTTAPDHLASMRMRGTHMRGTLSKLAYRDAVVMHAGSLWHPPRFSPVWTWTGLDPPQQQALREVWCRNRHFAEVPTCVTLLQFDLTETAHPVCF